MGEVLRVEVVGLRLELPANQPVLMLRETEGRRRLLTLYIGGPEASAIHVALEGASPPRPLTHDLTLLLLQAVGATLKGVTITELRSDTYFADLLVETANGVATVSGRPSDAVALALRAGVDVYVTASLMDEVGRESIDEASEEEAESVVDEFRDFLDSISPEDFSDPTS